MDEVTKKPSAWKTFTPIVLVVIFLAASIIILRESDRQNYNSAAGYNSSGVNFTNLANGDACFMVVYNTANDTNSSVKERGFWVAATNCTQLSNRCNQAITDGLFCGWDEANSMCKCEVSRVG